MQLFEEFQADDHVYIYPSSRKFYPQELPQIKEELEAFKNQMLEAFDIQMEIDLPYERFIVFAIHFENKSQMNKVIDQTASCILKLEAQYDISLLDRMNVSFKQGQYIQYKELKDFKKLIKNRSVTAKTVVFNNLITKLQDYRENWELPIEESWYDRYL
ncbi:MAG: ABC transporter ATPase [Flavobacteriaceae bacterium]